MENKSNVEIINNIGRFTVFVRIDASFEEFDVYRENQYDTKGTGKPVLGYNLFTIDGILSTATDGKVTSHKQIAKTGVVILISSVWNCNLDRGENEMQSKIQNEKKLITLQTQSRSDIIFAMLIIIQCIKAE